MKVKIINKSKHDLPTYATKRSTCMDLRANIDEDIILKPLKRKLISTGIFIQLPEDCEAQIRPRSGLALKHGVSVLNTPGSIDGDYIGEIMVILINLSDEDFVIKDGERIAQMVVAKYETVEWDEVDIFIETERGEGGFGHTGRK